MSFNSIVTIPRITIYPASLKTPVYVTATFTCNILSSDKVTVVWKKHHSKLPTSARIMLMESSVPNEVISILKIPRTIGYFDGEYYCVAYNRFGNATSKYASLKIIG